VRVDGGLLAGREEGGEGGEGGAGAGAGAGVHSFPYGAVTVLPW
jgi:hypothetical protein